MNHRKIANRKSTCRLCLALATTALVACTVGPDYQHPVLDIQSQWHEAGPETPTTNSASLALWWQGFRDAKLNALIAKALQDNLDLQAADAKLAASRAQTAITTAVLWPRLSGSSGYQRARLSPNALKGMLAGAIDGGQAIGALTSMGPMGTAFGMFQAGFDSSWEMDVFGGIKRQQEAAQAQEQAQVASRVDLQITLTAEVARQYLLLTALHKHLEIAQTRLEIQHKVTELARQLYREGLAGALDVERAETEQLATEATLPAIETQIKTTRHSLALLLGQTSDRLELEVNTKSAAIPSPPTLPVGTPAEVLRRRPDIRKAERQLAASSAAVGAALAELFPKLALTGAVGLQSQEISDFASLASGFYGFGPKLSIPIFQAGRLLGNLDLQEAKNVEALKLYEKSVLTAFREVEDALATLNGEYRHKQLLEATEANAQKSFASAQSLYAEGLTELQTVLETRRSWLATQDLLADSELAWSVGHVALFKALGGGWDNSRPASPHP